MQTAQQGQDPGKHGSGGQSVRAVPVHSSCRGQGRLHCSRPSGRRRPLRGASPPTPSHPCWKDDPRPACGHSPFKSPVASLTNRGLRQQTLTASQPGGRKPQIQAGAGLGPSEAGAGRGLNLRRASLLASGAVLPPLCPDLTPCEDTFISAEGRRQCPHLNSVSAKCQLPQGWGGGGVGAPTSFVGGTVQLTTNPHPHPPALPAMPRPVRKTLHRVSVVTGTHRWQPLGPGLGWGGGPQAGHQPLRQGL